MEIASMGGGTGGPELRLLLICVVEKALRFAVRNLRMSGRDLLMTALLHGRRQDGGGGDDEGGVRRRMTSQSRGRAARRGAEETRRRQHNENLVRSVSFLLEEL